MSLPVPDLRRALAEQPLLDGLADDLLDTLAGLAGRYRAEPGDLILREGHPTPGYFLVVAGQAAVEVSTPGRTPVVVDHVGPGGQLGWSWLVPPHVAPFDVVALEPLDALFLAAVPLRTACDAEPRLGYALAARILAAVGHRLSAARVRLLDIYGDGG